MVKSVILGACLFLLGTICGVFCTALIQAGGTEDPIDYDWYDHDESGLLEDE